MILLRKAASAELEKLPADAVVVVVVGANVVEVVDVVVVGATVVDVVVVVGVGSELTVVDVEDGVVVELVGGATDDDSLVVVVGVVSSEVGAEFGTGAATASTSTAPGSSWFSPNIPNGSLGAASTDDVAAPRSIVGADSGVQEYATRTNKAARARRDDDKAGFRGRKRIGSNSNGRSHRGTTQERVFSEGNTIAVCTWKISGISRTSTAQRPH